MPTSTTNLVGITQSVAPATAAAHHMAVALTRAGPKSSRKMAAVLIAWSKEQEAGQ
jgi:hypothetical protein